ncbi:hypothetical protein [Adlercreutzia sp. ZJ141]|uniref:hypothetical protein n=1 Tax=Adlercreutzia sp. ZJ141 TaxID=2709406 RepID=UPI0013E9A85A|nr:hypothetical protein [Adlercreutzia sp. ZJ141]
MKIEILYANSRIDVFDTDKLSPREPFAKTAAIVNYELRCDLLGERGLWLWVHTYDTGTPQCADSENPPVGTRKRGWRFLLAEAGELDDVERITADGEEISFRIGGELVDAVRFRSMVELLVDDAGRKSKATCACELYDILSEAQGFSASSPLGIAQTFGFGVRAMDAALALGGGAGLNDLEDN